MLQEKALWRNTNYDTNYNVNSNINFFRTQISKIKGIFRKAQQATQVFRLRSLDGTEIIHDDQKI